MIGLGLVLTMTTALAWAAARCPLGRALGLGMNCLADASRDPRGMLD
jgi:hypothetical protein